MISSALAALAPPDILTAHRMVAIGDELALLDAEWGGFDRCVVAVCRRSGAARTAARPLLAAMSAVSIALPRSPHGPAIWPTGLTGSLAHDDLVALAAVARLRDYLGVGIDVEPPDPLPPELIELVATPTEHTRYTPDLLGSRTLFCAKEAIYKAQYTCDREFLDFHDIEVDLDHGLAMTKGGRKIRVAATSSPRPLAVAWIPRTDVREAR